MTAGGGRCAERVTLERIVCKRIFCLKNLELLVGVAVPLADLLEIGLWFDRAGRPCAGLLLPCKRNIESSSEPPVRKEDVIQKNF